MKSIETEFDKFLNSSTINEWIKDSNLKIYVRKSNRIINGQKILMIDIANIVSVKNKGKGHFKKFMTHVESYKHPIYIESIQNPNLAEMLSKNGYKFVISGCNSQNMYKFC